VCQKNSLALKNRYPKVNCKATEDENKDSFDMWQKNAIEEYQINIKNELMGKKVHFEDQL
jgi:hypothetical protein